MRSGIIGRKTKNNYDMRSTGASTMYVLPANTPCLTTQWPTHTIHCCLAIPLMIVPPFMRARPFSVPPWTAAAARQTAAHMYVCMHNNIDTVVWYVSRPCLVPGPEKTLHTVRSAALPLSLSHPMAAGTEEALSVSDVKSTLILSLGLAVCRRRRRRQKRKKRSIDR